MPLPVIRANRAEVSDRFPLLGFTVRTGSKPFFEVVVTTDPVLLDGAQRENRTTGTFWSTRGIGPLPAERGEAVFIVPDEVLRRFVGASRLYYAAATFADRSRANPEVLDTTPTLVPSIAISSSYSGRRTRQLVGATAPGARWNGGGNDYTDTDTASLEWAGDAAKPGVESASPSGNGQNGHNGSGGQAATPANGGSGPGTSAASAVRSFEYDDGFGSDLWREPGRRPRSASRSRALAEPSSDAKWADVPLVPQLTNVSCWAAAAAMIVGWRDSQPADPAAIANGVGYWQQYRDGLDPADVAHLADVFDLAMEPPQTYTVDGFRQLVESAGPLWVAAAVPGPHAIVVTGIRGSGSPDATSVAINDPWGRPTAPRTSQGDYNPTPGSGSQYELTYTELMAEFESLGGEAGVGIQILHTKPEHMRGRRPMATAQAYGTRSPVPTTRRTARSRAQAVPAVVPIASAVVGATMTRVLSNEGDVSWELDQMRGLKHPNNDAARQGQANFTTTTTRVEGWPKVENGFTDEISADFEIRWQHNGHSLGNVDITPIHSNDAVGWGLEVKATINDDAHVYDGDVAALFVQFKYRFTRSVGSDWLAVTDLRLSADGRAEFTRQEWTQAETLALGSNGGAPARSQNALVAVLASPIANTILEMITDSFGDDITTQLPRLKGWKYVQDDPANGQRSNARTITTPITTPTVVNHVPEFLGDTMGCDLVITWAYDGRSVGEIQVRPANPRDTAAWSLNVTSEVYDDQQTYQPSSGPTCCAVRLLFSYNFSWTFGSGRIYNFDVILYGNGAVVVRNH